MWTGRPGWRHRVVQSFACGAINPTIQSYSANLLPGGGTVRTSTLLGCDSETVLFIKPESCEIDKHFQAVRTCRKAHFQPLFVPIRPFLRHFSPFDGLSVRIPDGLYRFGLTALLAGWGLGMGTEKEGNQPIHDQADPKIDQQPEIGPQGIPAMPGGRWEVGHEQKVDGVSQHHRGEGDGEVSRETHSPHLDT